MVPGGYIYVFTSGTSLITSCFVPVKINKYVSQADMILELLRKSGSMTPDSVATTLSIDLLRSRQMLSKLKRRGFVKRDGSAYAVI